MSAIKTNANGDAVVKGNYTKVGHTPVVIAAIATADATDLATSEALANANKAKINALLVELKAQGLIAT